MVGFSLPLTPTCHPERSEGSHHDEILHFAQNDNASALPDLNKASWIWASPKGVTDGEFACFFRKTFELPSRAVRATVLITADNGYDLFVNGALIGGDAGYDGIFWASVEMYRVEHLLNAGRNVMAVRGENMGGPAGLLVAARVELADGKVVELFSDATWKVSLDVETMWTVADFDEGKWQPAAVLGPNGMAPWNKLTYPGPVSPAHTGRGGTGGLTEPGKDFRFPAGVVFLRGRVPQSSTPGAPQAIWTIGGSRAYLENDTPGPAMLGHRLYSLTPARPDAKPKLLVDAGKGVIGSPSVSFDGKTIYFAMAPGEGLAETHRPYGFRAGRDARPYEGNFFHIYRVSADGSGLTQLTKGTFHDFDPEPLPDGRIAFSSTRIGSREEYHGNVARCLFTMNADGSHIRPLTYHIVGDNEPKVTAEGEIAFIRVDNFMERAKVETQVHIIRPDGTNGKVLFGANRGAIPYDRAHAAENDARWLRSFGFGSLAPLPDGRVACISANGVIVSSNDPAKPTPLYPAVNIADLSPLPDGRLLCTTASLGALGVLNPNTGDVTRIYSTDTYDLHSVVYLGARPKPPTLSSRVDAAQEDAVDKTGYLACQSVYNTKQTAADWKRVKAVRVIEAVPFTTRSARHPYDHIGVEIVELGTVPLAPDGSFHVRVPADKPLAIQLVDGEGRSVVNEMSWIYVRPGERRICIGCHESKHTTPVNKETLALRSPAVSLVERPNAHRWRGNNAANGGVLNLQFDRFREAAAINLYESGRGGASLPAPSAGRSDEVKRLCEWISDNGRGGASLPAPIAAIQRLAIFRDRAAVPALLKALKGENADVRMNAAVALSACGNREAVGGLLDALRDSVPAVALAANMALENLTAHSESFNPYDKAEWQNQVRAWREWFKQNDWSKMESDLIARLNGKGAAAVQPVIEALGHIGGDAAKRALREFVRSHQPGDLRATMAAMRALGYLRDEAAVPLLSEILQDNIGVKPGDAPANPEFGWLQKPVYLAATAAEALGWIGTPAAAKVLIDVYPNLQPFWYYTLRTGDHSWLMGCHSSVLHYRIAEALDAMGSREASAIMPHILRSIPIDTDRALLLENDSYETLVARVAHHAGVADEIVETCLSVLGDTAGRDGDSALREAVTASPPAESVGPLGKESRAAQIASIVCLNPKYAPRLRAVFDHYRAQPPSRERSWTCFYLARALGKLRDKGSVPSLLAALNDDPTEASFGYETPPNVFLYKAMTPFYRAAAAYALGEIGDAQAVPTLLKVVENFDNAMDVRHAAARALEMLATKVDGEDCKRLKALAAEYPEIATRRALLRACAGVK